ncbi:hypothetical protein BDA96_03G000300 [Sorghum bicolor]|uniref:ABA induced plasma membrane protein PM 19 n=2 Tax=Sorghum bicolor TaxID=4558 RepID=A0A921RB40_SORBI|nr:uncharacterized protein LOC8078065 [Sorghum bicolor]EER99977.1 hypothetical protein SORBI_3003G000200 [Sorghum bicolor]KAG0535680.1 hypothetical protein BDA96_03G000300 [Sorghum bicolor]|eukprot:XP_002454858.1 uncharacterized protein LOC8078065 [Sorghum bicolor]
MAENLKPVALLLLLLNLCMYVILAIIGGWALNVAIDRGFIIGPELRLPAHFHPIFFPIGNFATGFFVLFSLLAGVVGIASAIVGFNHLRFWNYHSLQPAAALGLGAWALTVLAMGLACQEISFDRRNAKLGTMETFTIILTVTQFFYVLAIHGGSHGPAVPVERRRNFAG